MKYLTRYKIIGAIVLTILMLIVFLQNQEMVTTSVLFIDFSMPLVFLLLITFTIGIAVGLLIAFAISRQENEKLP